LPTQSRMPVPAAEAAVAELAAHAASLDAISGGNLLDCFAGVPDPRDPRGVRHSLASLLAMCTAAVLCGHTALEEITAWVVAAPQEVLAAAGCRRNGLGVCVPPHPDTIERVFTLLSAQQLADHTGALLARRAQAGPVTFPIAGRAARRQSRWTARPCAAPLARTGRSRTCWPPPPTRPQR
jgi:hypothetical protein